jgi:hypothetical protein
MRKLSSIFGVLILVATLTTVAYAGGNSKVEYTWTISDLGQGAWGGGPLYADGSADGYLPVSLADGQIIFQLDPTSWYEVDGGAAVDICFNVEEIKGSSGFPPSLCLSDLGVVLPVSGTPIVVSDPDSSMQTLIRVTPAN